jgi:hypothetical protein
MQPVIDPAEWSAESLGPVRDWTYRITDQDQDELLAAVDHFRRLERPMPDVSQASFPLSLAPSR